MNIPNVPLTVNCELKLQFSLTQKSPTNSQLSQTKFLKTKQPVRNTVNCIIHSKMNRRPETRGFKGGFLPAELKSTDAKGQNTNSATQWQGSSDREESLSDPRWHKGHLQKERKRTPTHQNKQNTESTTNVQDAKEVITKKKIEETRQNQTSPKSSSLIIGENKTAKRRKRFSRNN